MTRVLLAGLVIPRVLGFFLVVLVSRRESRRGCCAPSPPGIVRGLQRHPHLRRHQDDPLCSSIRARSTRSTPSRSSGSCSWGPSADSLPDHGGAGAAFHLVNGTSFGVAYLFLFARDGAITVASGPADRDRLGALPGDLPADPLSRLARHPPLPGVRHDLGAQPHRVRSQPLGLLGTMGPASRLRGCPRRRRYPVTGRAARPAALDPAHPIGSITTPCTRSLGRPVPAPNMDADRQPRQAPRVRLPVERDLWRDGRLLGLRAARRRAQEQRQGRLVAPDGPAARRHRWARRGDHHEPAGVGGLRPRRRLQRPDGRLPQLQAPLPRRRPQGTAVGDRLPELRQPGHPHRGAAVQPHVPAPTSARWRSRHRSPTCAPRPRRGSSSTSRTWRPPRARSCRSGSPRSARASATRSRRATSSSATASSSRWRWSSSSTPRRRSEWFAYWVAERLRWWTDAIGIGADRLRLRPHDPDELSHYSRQTTDIEYAIPDGLVRAGRDRRPHRLRPEGARRGLGKVALRSSTRRAASTSLPYVIEPAMGVDRAVLTVLLDGYEEQQVEGEKRVVLHLRPSLAPIKVAVMPLLRNRPELVELGAAPGRRPEGADGRHLRRHRQHRQALPPPGRDRHAVLRDRRRRDRCTTAPPPSASATR